MSHSSAFPDAAGLQIEPAHGWQPDAGGLPRAVALAASIVALLMGGLVLLAGRIAPPPPPVTVQLMDAASAMPVPAVAAASPAPAEAAAPPLAEAAPPPNVEPPVAVPSPIALATPAPAAVPALPLPLPQRPEPHRPRTTQSHVRSQPAPGEASSSARAAPAPLLAAPQPNAAPPLPADVGSGLGPYRAGLHRQIERNMLSDAATTQLGVSGTAIIEATIAPDGRVVSARLARSSGIRAIDGAALGAVQRGGFPAFGPHMPAGPITVSVPIGVEAD